MNNLCADIGWKSINHDGEQLCGDHIDIVEPNENSTILVLADEKRGLAIPPRADSQRIMSQIIDELQKEGE